MRAGIGRASRSDAPPFFAILASSIAMISAMMLNGRSLVQLIVLRVLGDARR